MRMRIEGAGHCVDVEVNDVNWTPEKLAALVKKTWETTRVSDRRMQVGYGSQLTSQASDQPVHGSGPYERKPDPVKS